MVTSCTWLSCSAAPEILTTRCVMTVINGEIVYEAKI
jgi:hypothetical protein